MPSSARRPTTPMAQGTRDGFVGTSPPTRYFGADFRWYGSRAIPHQPEKAPVVPVFAGLDSADLICSLHHQRENSDFVAFTEKRSIFRGDAAPDAEERHVPTRA